jgi:hypothetical protein
VTRVALQRRSPWLLLAVYLITKLGPEVSRGTGRDRRDPPQDDFFQKKIGSIPARSAGSDRARQIPLCGAGDIAGARK